MPHHSTANATPQHSQRHTTMPHHYATPLCHTTMPHHYATPLCHTTMPHHYATPLCYTTMPHHYATPLCHTTMPHHTTTPINPPAYITKATYRKLPFSRLHLFTTQAMRVEKQRQERRNEDSKSEIVERYTKELQEHGTSDLIPSIHSLTSLHPFIL